MKGSNRDLNQNNTHTYGQGYSKRKTTKKSSKTGFDSKSVTLNSNSEDASGISHRQNTESIPSQLVASKTIPYPHKERPQNLQNDHTQLEDYFDSPEPVRKFPSKKEIGNFQKPNPEIKFSKEEIIQTITNKIKEGYSKAQLQNKTS